MEPGQNQKTRLHVANKTVGHFLAAERQIYGRQHLRVGNFFGYRKHLEKDENIAFRTRKI